MGVLGFIDVLKAELVESLTGYTIEAREPIEGELKADVSGKQIFITTEGIESPEGVADLARSTVIRIPVLVSCVMQFPKTEADARKVLKRRLSMMQACQRAVFTYCVAGAGAGNTAVYLEQEQPNLIEEYYVAIVELIVEYDLQSTGEPE